ncbi:MAG: HAD family hydrolase [Propionibacteriaceae bacterium]|nr:HAD family hydrolase [Propionibacteriaceae bacterium]
MPSSDRAYQHIFWDMGGTIVNTYPPLDAELAGVIRSRGGRIDDHDVALLTRRSTGEAISVLAQRFHLEESLFRAAEASLKYAWRTSPPPAMPGIHEAMAAITGLNLVVTHRDRASASSLLEALGITVDDLICAPDGHPRKPDPAMHRALLERHGLDPERCVSVGDRPIDAIAAHAAGMDAVMLRTPRIDFDNDAEHQVEHLADLLPLLA